jgi:hypothetical protein
MKGVFSMHRFQAFLWALAVSSGLSAAALAQGPVQAPSPEAQHAIQQAREKHPNLSVKINPLTGLPSTVRGLNPGNSTTRQAAAPASEPTKQEIADAVTAWFVRGELRSAFAPQNVNARYLCTGPEQVFPDNDVPGQYVAKVVQEVDIEGHPAVPVFGAHGKVAMDRSLAPRNIVMNASRVSISTAPPSISEAAAIEAARAKLQELMAASANNPFALRLPNPRAARASAQLVVFDPALVKSRGEVSGPTRLAWLVSIGSLRAFVDASSREVFMHYYDQPSANGRRVFDLAGSTVFPGRLARGEQGDAPRPATEHADVEDAFVHAGIVRDFFNQVFARDGYDASVSRPTGSRRRGLDSYVRFGMEKNAWWCSRVDDGCPQADVMVYGPGFAAALDVVGHEITHGIVKYEADLLYLHEPGAVNEALADIFGTLIEFHAKGSTGNWTIGENLPGRSAAWPLRDMANPRLGVGGASRFARDRPFDPRTNYGQPDFWTDYVRPTDPICRALPLQDNGCVHFNSGIINKFAYLISEGGTHTGVTVAGIGRAKLGRIAYRSLTHYLHNASGLQDTAEAFTLACADLARADPGGISLGDCAQVQKARQAVGLDVPTG